MQRKNILIAPLDWGLGHATRCIPIIEELKKSHQVIIAAGGNSGELLKNEFPTLIHIYLPTKKIKYSNTPSLQSLFIALQAFPFLISEFSKKNLLKKIINTHKIDLIISDNRYGIVNKSIPSVCLTHQIFLPIPFPFNNLTNYFIKKFLLKFDTVLVPDFKSKKNSLSGKLSHKKTHNFQFINPLSRFKKHIPRQLEKKYDAIIVLSGPENQRTQLENLLTSQLQQTTLSVVFVRGLSSDTKIAFDLPNNSKIFNQLPYNELLHYIELSKTYIGRCGYTTIMDLIHIEIPASLIPTPNQAEQEYLAIHLKETFYMCNQDTINIQQLIAKAKNNNTFPSPISNQKLYTTLTDLLKQ